jgi:hypothetical protein
MRVWLILGCPEITETVFPEMVKNMFGQIIPREMKPDNPPVFSAFLSC